MKKWNLIVDVARCHNSNNCFLSVADEYAGNKHDGYTEEMPLHGHHWIDIKKKERGAEPIVDVAYVPTTCMHCDDAPCIKAAEKNAITKRDDGIVIIDPERAKGQKQLVDACPYGAIWWNDEKDVPQAWPFDAHLLDRGWKEPRCVQACPTGALKSMLIEDSDREKVIAEHSLEELHPEHGTKPRVLYKNLHLYSKCFIAGTAVTEKDGVEDCLEGAIVIVHKDGAKVGETVTDAFGEFKLDKLDPDSGTYDVEILHPDHQTLDLKIDLADSVYTGVHKMVARGG
jgi:Fe-S-cluster-containing dehydrogenase component